MASTTSVDRTPPAITRDAADALATDLVAEMTRRWRAGERPLPEEFLGRCPRLWDHPEAAADLIYEELCLREEFGPDVSVENVLERFPQWRPQLEVLFDCQRLLGPRRSTPRFPSAGESLGDFLLLAELGRGLHGRVFLASQLSLGDRPVVLKLTPCDASEHLSLARLQHTNIVPLYCVQDHPHRGLRALCMPYFGGATLGRLLTALRSTPTANRSGQSLLDALDAAPAVETIVPPPRAPRPAFADESYAHALCRIGACLADALQYAHDRGLVHLDLKPSNVLLTADGQPMVLDFHLAREPIHPDDPGPMWLGGTPGYMSPEQAAALDAVREARPAPQAVDGRSDVFSLGVVLYEALAGGLPSPTTDFEAMTTVRADSPHLTHAEALFTKCSPLHLRNPQVSVGLSDVIHKCLAADPARRYQTMAALATDLRRHVTNRPLVGVRNRSLVERWQKWRRRRPHGVALAGMMCAVLAAAGAVALGLASHVTDRIDEARGALSVGRVQIANQEWDLAGLTLRRGLAAVQGIPMQGELHDELNGCLDRAEAGRSAADRSAAAAELHRLADRARYLYGAEHLPPAGATELAAGCRQFWADRQRIVDRLNTLSSTTRANFFDVAICWADLQTDRSGALAILDQAQDLLGASPVLDAERRLNGWSGEPRRTVDGRDLAAAGKSAWDHYALGRALLRAGDLDGAARATEQAVKLEPFGLWPNFYQGVIAYRRGKYMDAAAAFGVCIGAAPDAAGCYYNRALAFAALGRNTEALRDYDAARRLDASLASTTLDALRRTNDKSSLER
jgi:serine/threonine protein kinase/tetratricopeptide (TPR) repeat protein